MRQKPLYESRSLIDLRDMFLGSCHMFADKAAFLTKTDGAYHPITFRQFEEDFTALGAEMAARGLVGRRIAVIGSASYHWSLVYAAVVSGIGVLVPIDRELPPEEIVTLMNTAEVSAVFYGRKLEEKIENVRAFVPTLEHCVDMEAEMTKWLAAGKACLREGSNYTSLPIDPESMAVLMFTSGTTAAAKGVMLSHHNICGNLMAMTQMIDIRQSDIFLSVLPIHHAYESTCGFLCALYRGATVAYAEGLRQIPRNLQETHATIMLGVPLLLENVYRQIWRNAEKTGKVGKLRFAVRLNGILRKLHLDLSKQLFGEIHQAFGGSLRLLISGAAAMDPHVSRGLQDMGFMVLQGYGLTECAPIGALNRDCFFDDASIGLPLPGTQIKVDAPNEEGCGELMIQGPNVMMGYFENPEATAAVMEDGWFRTGDIGYMDKRGFVFLTGRKKNVIVTKNGKNIYPEELETYLNRSPYIAESLVTGRYDAALDDMLVTAQLLPDLDAVAVKLGADYTEEALHQLLDAEVDAVNRPAPTYKRVAEWKVRTTPFHKTTTQKIKRHLEK